MSATGPDEARPAIHFVSLGCPKNRVDTEVMLGVSARAGYRHVDDPHAAEVIVVNTCGFVEAAKQESIETVLELAELKQQGLCRTLIMTGCLSQRYAGELAQGLPEVDHFLGSSDMLALGALLGESPGARVQVGNPANYLVGADDPRILSGSRASAYVKIAEGCSRRCAFCAIPSFRGKLRSRPVADVAREVQRLTEAGTAEINLISQDTVSYGRDLPAGEDLLALLERLESIATLRWLRLFYLYPEALPDALLERLAGHGKLVPYLDMPLQHASSAMLKRMHRGYDADRIGRLLERVRTAAPGVTIRTAFIVGHPGETDADFQALMELVQRERFDHVGLFRYSPEEGTSSHDQDGAVPEAVIEERLTSLSEVQHSIAREKLSAQVGQVLEVLVEGLSEESELLLQGRHRGQAPEVDGVVLLTDDEAKVGSLRRARVTQSGDYDLIASLLPESEDRQATATAAGKRLPLLD
ncbi:MAG: 30S ribosomal protein S12 methylthiotransferase RimO [Myxococcales bacterium]|nr:30S ribosomal protein S12 methylthiotransferase RimO [Myxococcales bacterium]